MTTQLRREAHNQYASRRIFWAILIALSLALAIGLPVAGYQIVEQFRRILLLQVLHDNDVISRLFDAYLQDTRAQHDGVEDWLEAAQQNAGHLISGDRGFICLIDSNANMRVAPPMLGGVRQSLNLDQALLFPIRPSGAGIEHDNPIPLSSLLMEEGPQRMYGLLRMEDGAHYVDFRASHIGDQTWLIGVHQYERAVQERLRPIYHSILVTGSLLFLAIVLPFAFFTNRLMNRHEMERASYIQHIEENSERINQVNEQLQEANQRLRAIQEEKNHLYARLSHDLRTPLNSVLAACDMVADGVYGAVNKAQLKAMAAIERNVNILVQLINAILQLVRLESGRYEANITQFSLGELLEELRDNLHPLAEQKNLSLRFEAPTPAPLIHSDREKLYLVLQNLASNALRCTDDGEVLIVARPRESGGWIIAVRDSGPGIDPAEQQQIFEAFTQGGGSSEGVGLGLAITRELVQFLGGRMELESRLGEGAEFRIILPDGKAE